MDPVVHHASRWVAARSGSRATLTIGLQLRSADLPAACRDVEGIIECGDVELLVCDMEALVEIDAGTVDALCRLRLAARRTGTACLVRNAARPLRELVGLMGLADVLSDQATMPSSSSEASNSAGSR